MIRVLSRVNLRILGLPIIRRFVTVTPSVVKYKATNLCHLRNINQQFTIKRFLSVERYSSITANIDKNTETIDIVFDDQSSSRYPFVWLRDNCLCDSCLDRSCLQRKIILEEFDIDVAAKDIVVDTNVKKITIHWADDHVSDYPMDWLKNYKFPQIMDHIEETPLRYWGSEMSKDKIQTFSFVDIMNDDSVLYSWLVSLHTDGISLLKDMGSDEKNCAKLTERVGLRRATCFGFTYDIKSTSDPCNLAYTGCRLCLHNDLPFYLYEPCVEILHGIKVSQFGGESEFVDGFKIAHDLQKNDTETFHILTTVPIGYSHHGIDGVTNSEYLLKHSKPVISLDSKGNIKKISFNQHVRGIRTGASVEDIKSVYRALKTFNSTLYKKENLVSFKIQEGEAVCFNNLRILHGRAEFFVPAGNQVPRHLHGNYIDWDAIYSRIRVIAKNKNIFF